MQLYEAVDKRRSVREFQWRHVEEEKLHRILEAGLKTPPNNHLRQWEYILVKDPDQRKRVAKLVVKAKTITNEMELEKTLDRWQNQLQKEMYSRAIPSSVSPTSRWSAN